MFSIYNQARKIKRCFNKRDDCLSHEILLSTMKSKQNFNLPTYTNQTEYIAENMMMANEDNGMVQKEQDKNNFDNRLLINPEFAEAMDTSDGSEMFSPEDQKIEDAATELD